MYCPEKSSVHCKTVLSQLRTIPAKIAATTVTGKEINDGIMLSICRMRFTLQAVARTLHYVVRKKTILELMVTLHFYFQLIYVTYKYRHGKLHFYKLAQNSNDSGRYNHKME